ncbi:MAG: hypothetical protein EA397_07430 [Deltaproteobacteria bacterium]|nr:MAG: hypothetical protein EA397_07430 [Deltaproteobacteria bacterium]
MSRPLLLASLMVAASACALDSDEHADTLLVPASVELHWNDAFNAVDDGLGAVVPVDIMVYDSASGEPRSDVSVQVRAPLGVAALTEGELVRLPPEWCVDCLLFWDAYRDHYYAMLVDPSDAVRTELQTDDEGLARVFLVVDSLDVEGGSFGSASVLVATEAADASIRLVPR